MGAPTRGAQPCQQGSTVFKPASRVKTRIGWIRLVCVAGLFSLAAQPSPSPANPQLQIRHHARSLGPGEVVRFSLSLPQPAKQVRLKAWDKTFACFRVSPQHWEGLLGIDLAIPAGDYPVDVEVDGVLQPRQLMLKVASKTFPTRHLTVDPKFVTPPADELERIRRESRQVASIFKSVTPKRLWNQAFVLPVPGAPTSGFGKRSVLNRQPRSPHSGTDFSAGEGTPVRSPNSGRVVLAAPLYYSGNTVILDHGLGLYSYFGHLSRIEVRKDEEVVTGQVVGLVGATGRVTGAHLHWTVRLAQTRVDPISLLAVLEPE